MNEKRKKDDLNPKVPSHSHPVPVKGSERGFSKRAKLSRVQWYALRSSLEKIKRLETEHAIAQQERENLAGDILEDMGYTRKDFLRVDTDDGDVSIFAELPEAKE